MNEGGLEEHLEGVLEPCKELLAEYRTHLAHVNNLDTFPEINREEGDCYFRFKLEQDRYDLNRLYYIYGIEQIAPNLRWRNLLRNSIGLHNMILNRHTAFLPSYSFSLDKLCTFVYWGEKQFFFDPIRLEQLKLKNFLLDLQKPSSAKISSSNFCWPKEGWPISNNKDIADNVTRRYIFNALFPPDLKNFMGIWKESPFITMGDRTMEIYTLHKSICFVKKHTIKYRGNFILANAVILDNDLQPVEKNCLISRRDDILDLDSVFESLIIKSIRIFPDTQKSSTRLFVYPFKSDLFGDDSPGTLLTVLSICLRYMYLNSDCDLTVGKVDEIIQKMDYVLSQYPFSNYKWDEIGARQVVQKKSIGALLGLLGIYLQKNDEVTYFHPVLVECLSTLFSEIGKALTYWDKKYFEKLSDIMDDVPKDSFLGFSNKLRIQSKVEELFENRPLRDIGRFTISLQIAKTNIIPFSKTHNKLTIFS